MKTLQERTKALQNFMHTHPHLDQLSIEEIHPIYMALIDCLIDHNHLYYVKHDPMISDQEYDELFAYVQYIEEQFPQLITSNSPTQQLVGQTSEGFLQARHSVKLLSLENTYTAKDLYTWHERIQKILDKHQDTTLLSYSIEPKFDGLSVELVYKQGIFFQAITRGDGRVGDDITQNAKTIKNIPQRLHYPRDIHVRGEIVMPKSIRKELNQEREQEGEVPFANTRNAAAGSIKLLDTKEVAKRKLLCFVYDLLPSSSLHHPVTLKDLWFDLFPRKKTWCTIDEVVNWCEDEGTKVYIHQQDIECDGLVIKVESLHHRALLWTTDHHPRRAVAYKFPAQLAATQINTIDIQVGRTGILTPVANIQPVQLSWAILKRVSLHNWDFIKEKDIRIHDWIWIQRSGEVIPYIVSVIHQRRSGNEKIITLPTQCPSCQHAIIQKDTHYYCINPHCPQKIKQQLLHFVSKQCMDIQGIGESMIDILVDNKIVKTVADIYKLEERNIQLQLMKFPGIGEKKIHEIIKGIHNSKQQPLRRILHALGIPHIGKKMAQDIALQIYATNCQTQDHIECIIHLLTDNKRLSTIYGIGEKTIQSIKQCYNI